MGVVCAVQTARAAASHRVLRGIGQDQTAATALRRTSAARAPTGACKLKRAVATVLVTTTAAATATTPMAWATGPRVETAW